MRISDWSSDVCSSDLRDLSFEQAQTLSGRSINITVSPAGTNQPPRLLNHLTFPYLCVREAVLASCAEIGRASCRERVCQCRSRWAPYHQKKKKRTTRQKHKHNDHKISQNRNKP